MCGELRAVRAFLHKGLQTGGAGGVIARAVVQAIDGVAAFFALIPAGFAGRLAATEFGEGLAVIIGAAAGGARLTAVLTTTAIEIFGQVDALLGAFDVGITALEAQGIAAAFVAAFGQGIAGVVRGVVRDAISTGAVCTAAA